MASSSRWDSADDPPEKRGLVLVDGVDGSIVEWFVEDNPEDWAEFDPADVAGFECVVELGFLGGRSRMGSRPVGALLVVP